MAAGRSDPWAIASRPYLFDGEVAAPDGAAIPPCFDGLLARLAAVPRHVLPWDGLADNLTVNEYLPGAGIANHVDTHSAFEDGICALTLGDDCAPIDSGRSAPSSFGASARRP